jgi:predicted kinase
MNKGKLYFCCGLQRSGKSTFCKKWLYENLYLINDNYELWLQTNPRVIVSGDDIRLATHGTRYNKLAEDSVFSTLHIMIRTLLITGFDVIVDETNTSEISIRRLLEIDEYAIAIRFDTSEEICIQRAIDSGQSDLVSAIKRTSNNLKLIDERGGLNIFMNQILEEVRKRKYEYNKTVV